MALREISDPIAYATGINPDLLNAQLRLESTDGTSTLATQYHNYGGLKGVEGMNMTDDGFIIFKDDEDYINYSIKVMPRYGLVGKNDPDSYIQALIDSSYIVGNDIESYNNNLPALMGGESHPEPPKLNWENIVANTDDQSVTNTDNLRPESVYGLNLLGDWARKTTGRPLLLTGGAEWGYHSGDGKDFTHSAGWKADVWIEGCTGNTEGGRLFKEYVNSQGYSCNWENNHWDIDFSGSDSRDPQTPKVTFGNFWDVSGMGNMLDNQVGYLDDPAQYNVPEQQPVKTLGFWEALAENFWDSVSSSGVADVVQLVWGSLAHSGGNRQPVKQEDIDYVKNALPNDKEAQEFCLLNGLDSEEIRWLVNQKLVDKQRREAIEEFKAGHEWSIQNALVKAAGAVGYLVDPLNLLPVAKSFTVVKALGRLGETVSNVNKITQLAQVATKAGIQQAAYATTDEYLKKNYGGEKVDYANTALMSFFAGGILSAGGGIFKMLSKGGTTARIAQVADHVEDKAILRAMDSDVIEKAKSETHGKALEIHDTTFDTKVKSKVYQKLRANERVIATTYDKARAMIEEASGMVLPKSVKALYVPNEDYTILLTDKINPKEVDNLLAHEIGTHGGIKRALGDKGYNTLMRQIQAQADKEGTVFFEAKQRAGSYDPEEILAQLIEDGKLPDSMWSKMKGFINKSFGEAGFENVHMDKKRIEEIMRQQIEAKRNPYDIYVNEDGSTAFAGMKFSQDNLFNAQRLADVIELDSDAIRKETQGDLKGGSVGRRLGQMLEQGITGLGLNSVSNTLRKWTPRLWEDPRGRGLGDVHTITAETHKQQIIQQLSKPYLEYCKIRQQYCGNNWLKRILNAEAGHKQFDKLTTDAYNQKYGGNSAITYEYPKEIWEAVEKIHEYRMKQIELGKKSSTNVGSRNKNLIDEDWYSVDDEMWRITDREQVGKFLQTFVNITKDGKVITAKEQASKFLADYYRSYAKRDIIKAKLQRDAKLANKKIKAENDALVKSQGAEAKLKELKDENITDDAVEKYLNTHIPNAVKQLLEGHFDPVRVAESDAKLGKLSFLQERIPIDTSGVMEVNNRQFSFDNNLRLYDMDNMVIKNMNRFAGECAMQAKFVNTDHLKNTISKVESQLQTAVTQGKINANTAAKELREFKKAICELRGMRLDDNSDEAMSKMGALLRIARNLSYVKNGANMGFNQFGELGGTIAYGGVKQLFHIFPSLGRFVDDLTEHKVAQSMVRETEDAMFGANLESQIFSHSWGDRVVRDALTDDSITSSALKTIADKTYNLGKLTSGINMLPKMTDSMLRGMRTGFITDSIKVAHGLDDFVFRDPFSKAKLRMAHVSEKEWQHIQENIRKYSAVDKNGKVTKLDINKWFNEDVVSYQKWYNMIQLQAERGMTVANRNGNKNLLKNSNGFWSTFFQFKDYTLRSINAQTMRAMTAGDKDDLYSALLSMVTNTMVYGARAAMTYEAMKLSGADEKAEKYWDRMFSDGNLVRAIATRSAIIGSPLSFANDAYEAFGGDMSIRTTVDNARRINKGDLTADETLGNVLGQLPAVKELSAPLDVANVISHAEGDKFTKRDLDTLTRLIPIPRLFLLNTFIDKATSEVADSLGIPEKKRR